MKIAVDFDGTVVEDAYPEIGKPKPFALETLKKLSHDHQIILWTCRTGSLLDKAVEFLKNSGVRLYAVNQDSNDEQIDLSDMRHFMRKVDADIFIDDRNFGGFPGWGKIWQQLGDGNVPDPEPAKKKWFWQR